MMHTVARPSVLCPQVTPFTDGDVDVDALHRATTRLIEAGVDGVVPCGTTGEFASLSAAEYGSVLRETVDVVGGRVPVIAGTAGTSVQETLERIDRAADLGVDAAMIPLPYFHTANDPRGNRDFLQQVVGGSQLPCYLYNIPACTGTEIDVDTVVHLASIDNCVGLKDSGGDFHYFTRVEAATPDEFHLFQGFDAFFVPGLEWGATGGIHAMTNAVPEPFVEARDLVEAGDLEAARRVQRGRISPLFQQCMEHGFAPVAKAAMAVRGFLSTADVRVPLVQLSTETFTDIENAVEAAVGER